MASVRPSSAGGTIDRFEIVFPEELPFAVRGKRTRLVDGERRASF